MHPHSARRPRLDLSALHDPGGIIVTILIGIAGGLLGGFLGSQLGLGGGNIINIVLATVGAIILLWGYRMFRKRSV